MRLIAFHRAYDDCLRLLSYLLAEEGLLAAQER